MTTFSPFVHGTTSLRERLWAQCGAAHAAQGRMSGSRDSLLTKINTSKAFLAKLLLKTVPETRTIKYSQYYCPVSDHISKYERKMSLRQRFTHSWAMSDESHCGSTFTPAPASPTDFAWFCCCRWIVPIIVVRGNYLWLQSCIRRVCRCPSIRPWFCLEFSKNWIELRPEIGNCTLGERRHLLWLQIQISFPWNWSITLFWGFKSSSFRVFQWVVLKIFINWLI